MATDQFYITDKQSVKDGINMEIFKCFDWVKPQPHLLFYKPVKHLLKVVQQFWYLSIF